MASNSNKINKVYSNYIKSEIPNITNKEIKYIINTYTNYKHDTEKEVLEQLDLYFKNL